MEKKICGKCKAKKALEQFNKGDHKCRSCRAIYRREYYQRNAGKEYEAVKQWRKRNPERTAEYKREWAKAHPLSLAQRQRVRERRRAFHQRHKARLNTEKKAYYAKNKAHILDREIKRKYDTRYGEWAGAARLLNSLKKDLNKRSAGNE